MIICMLATAYTSATLEFVSHPDSRLISTIFNFKPFLPIYRLGLTPEMENELLRVSPCSPDDVRLFRSNILRDDLFEPSPKAVPFNERPSAVLSMDLHEIGYSELSPGTCSTGDMIPCHGIVVFKGGERTNSLCKAMML